LDAEQLRATVTDLRIGILGAPGSGKSAFAKTLATKIRAEKGEVKQQTVKVVDGYMDSLVKRTGYAYDIFATYPQNLQILFERWTREQEAEKTGCDTLITVGSLYETILYTGLRVNSELALKSDKTIQMQGRVSMEMLGVTQSLIATHDLLLFLPYTEKVLAEKGRSYDVAINEKLPEVVAGYYRPLIPLTGTTKTKVKDALSAIKTIEEWKAQNSTVDDQQTV
jgi:ABC-type oligopeptide transport system ATPase subunit